MKLYYLPGACSLTANIVLREAGVPFELVKVDRRSKRAADGKDYKEINPNGYVPALVLDDGTVLTENIAVLAYIADRNPAAGLAPPAGSLGRYKVLEWLSFIGTELHKSFSPLFRQDAPEEAKQYARGNLYARLDYAERALGANSWLVGGQFSVADAYLFVVLSWGAHVDVDLGRWPQLKRLHDRVAARPCTVEALRAEGLAK
jgi:glutathione S-transferase